MTRSRRLRTGSGRRRRTMPICGPALLMVVLVLLIGCAKLPDNSGRSTSFSLEPDPGSTLAKTARQVLGTDSDQSAYLLIGDGLDAFVARAALAQVAETSIDAQYYLLHDDEVGRLFVDQLVMAADRGVRVRLLVDDIDMAGTDFGTAVLDSHPNIEVRLFNPFSRDTSRMLQFVTGWGEQTRRAHNKSFTADSIATIVGGRNIGNEYFVADPDTDFIDLDVLAIGPAASLVAGSFDLYWNHELSYPISMLVDTPPTPAQISERTEVFRQDAANQKDSVYVQALLRSNLAEAINSYRVELIPGPSRVVWDHPSKLLEYGEDSDMMIRDLLPDLEQAEKELLVITPYFVPGKEGVALLRGLRDRGVRVIVLTNSMSSTDVPVVHAGYSKYRENLLELGVELYELNRELSKDGSEGMEWKFYRSKASLHTKCFVIDRKKSFIGSLNLDPRSIVHNTEIGLLIDSPEIAASIASFIDREVESLAFRLELEQGGAGTRRIIWHGTVDGERTTLKREPYTGFWQRFMVGLMRLLPIESQL